MAKPGRQFLCAILGKRATEIMASDHLKPFADR